MKQKIKIISLIFVFIVLLMFNIWEKYEATQISYDIQKLVKRIGELDEQKKDLLVTKIRLESPQRLQKIAEQNLGMTEIDDKNMVIIGLKSDKK
jgi:cell division protein FtsL